MGRRKILNSIKIQTILKLSKEHYSVTEIANIEVVK